MNRDDILEQAKRVLSVEAEAVSALMERLGKGFVEAVDIIFSSKGRVIVSGMGKSGLVGNKIAATLASTGTPAYSMHPAEACHGDLGMVTAEDVVLGISNSGETDEIVNLIPYIKRFNVKLIAMTGNTGSTLALKADAVLDVSVAEEACPMGIVPTASTTATLAMGDALAVALLVKRGFREEDFAAYHPKGSLGKKLITQVRDLMHAGENVPRVKEDTPVTDALMEISGGRLGMTTVVDSVGKLLGVVTDGDVRRGVERHGEKFFRMKAGEVMTPGPKSITADRLAQKALAVMEEHAITALVVLDAEGRPEGVIHIHDILKEGIA
jgi:arabinose-5-phosphate isomerase